MPLLANTTTEELYARLADMGIDIEELKCAEKSYDELVKMYLYLLDVELMRFRHQRIVVPKKSVC